MHRGCVAKHSPRLRGSPDLEVRSPADRQGTARHQLNSVDLLVEGYLHVRVDGRGRTDTERHSGAQVHGSRTRVVRFGLRAGIALAMPRIQLHDRAEGT